MYLTAIWLFCLILIGYYDLRYRRIPNRLLLLILAIALLAQWQDHGGYGLATAAAGGLIGAFILFIPTLLGGIGAGDLKFLAVTGTWLGSSAIIPASLIMALSGGILLLAVWVVTCLQTNQYVGLKQLPPLPYALSIISGAVYTNFWY